MDGFKKNENIVVIGATNNEGELDSAAVRPGRFDKKIHVPKPDLGGRKDLFNHFLKSVSHDTTVDVDKLAKMTPGFTGADVQNMINTAIS
jgi:ATP-dependent metalloprotease